MTTTPSQAHIEGQRLLLQISESVKAARAALTDNELAAHRAGAVGAMICLARGRPVLVSPEMIDDYLRAMDDVITLTAQTFADIKARRENA
jgi:hypothetical protein